MQETGDLLHRKESNSRENNIGHRNAAAQMKLKAVEQPRAHKSFFRGLLSHLNKSDDGEVLEFQMGVLQVI